MRSLQQKPCLWLALTLAVALFGAACSGSETIANDVAEDSSSAAAPTAAAATEPETAADPTAAAPAPESEAAPAAEATVRGAWVIEIQGGRVVSSPDETICLKIPGGTFTVNGGGDNGFGGQFYFYLSNEGGNTFNYEINGNATVGIEPEVEGVIDINYDADSGATTVTSLDGSALTIDITGMC